MTAPVKILSLAGSDPALKQYEALLYATWLKSLRYGNEWFSEIDAPHYFRAYHNLIELILKRPATIVRLAVLPDDADVCIGWSVSEGETLHYVFVKGDIQARRQGIGTLLVPENVTRMSHITKTGRAIWKAKRPNWKFQPFE